MKLGGNRVGVCTIERAGNEVGVYLVRMSPLASWTRDLASTPKCCHKAHAFEHEY